MTPSEFAAALSRITDEVLAKAADRVSVDAHLQAATAALAVGGKAGVERYLATLPEADIAAIKRHLKI